MSQQNLEHSTAKNFRFLEQLKLHSKTKTLAADLTVLATDPPLHFLDPGGAGRKVLLPVASVANAGLVFVFVNTADAAEVLTIKDSTDTTTFATPTLAEAAILFCNGVTWGGLVGASS